MSSALVLARHNEGVRVAIESISLFGVRVAGTLTLDVGERVLLVFERDDGSFELSAEVVKTEKRDAMTDRVALRFVDVAPEVQAILRELASN